MKTIEHIYKNVTDSPLKIILSDEYGEYSNLDVWKYSSKVYAYLSKQNVGRESIVLVHLPRSAKSVMVMLGVIRSGAAVVLSEDWGSESHQWHEFLINETHPVVEINERLLPIIDKCEPKDGFVIPDLHDLAYIKYSTGTTGKRKGVMLEYGTIERYNNDIYIQDSRYEKYYEQRHAITVTLHSAVIFLLLHLASNSPSDIVPLSTFDSWPDFINRLNEKKITTFSCSALDLRKRGIPETPYLNYVVPSFEPALGLFSGNTILVNEYGMTETGTTVTLFVIDRKYDIAPIGKPLPGFSVRIVDENGNEVPDGEYGEICIDCIYCRGYLHQPELTADHFRDGWFYSHDLGKRLPDGNFIMYGRMKDCLHTANGWIIGLEIELAAQKILGQYGAYVKIFRDSETPVICLYTDFDIDFPKLQNDLRAILPHYMIPTDHVRVRRFFVNNGKIIRSTLLPPERIERLKIRNATPDDAPFIVWALIESAPSYERYRQKYFEACLTEDMLFSYRRARIAEIGGRAIGCQVAMSGIDYKIYNKKTCLAISSILTEEDVDNAPLPTEEDEYFLNGIAVIPEYRGQNISEKLIMDSVRIGEKLGFRKSTFIVDINHPRLIEHYERIGFKIVKKIEIFGFPWYKMTMEVKAQ